MDRWSLGKHIVLVIVLCTCEEEEDCQMEGRGGRVVALFFIFYCFPLRF